MSDSKRQQRARQRRERMVIRRARLGDDVDVAPIAGAAAVSLAARLSRYAWELTGAELPRHARAELPYRFVPSDPGERAGRAQDIADARALARLSSD